jgi:polyhydroxyalkanoate synthase
MTHSLPFDGKSKDRLEFATRQFIDAMSPANFAATNPEVLKLALESNGESFTQGIQNLIEDISKGRVSTTRESEFEVGRNLAITEGKVVFENELIQLIQYAPTTAEVYKRPLVMVPPSINKYYIMDMTPESSLVRFAVDQGHTVFMISWRNITGEQGQMTWDDYLRLGVMDAIDAAADISRSDKVNVLGFCVGGTILASALAVLAAEGDDRIFQTPANWAYSSTSRMSLPARHRSVPVACFQAKTCPSHFHLCEPTTWSGPMSSTII